MPNKKIASATLVFIFISLFICNADPLIGTAGSMSYYSNELGKFGVGSGETGPDGSLNYAFTMGIVAAAYNSNIGRWVVGQTSTISREIKWGTPTYSDNDIFTLDGVELVYAGGTNPRIYHARKQNYSKIKYINPGQSDSYWEITSTDGSKRLYGNTADSRIEAIGRPAGQPRAWALGRMTDAGNFNFTNYYYIEDTVDGGFYLTKLVTGKSAAAANGFKSTKIYYENESNPVLSYREGSKVKVNKRPVTVVDVIGCNNAGSGGSPVSAFKISWMQTSLTKKSLVSSITQYGTDVQLGGNGAITGGSSLPPATFEYAAFSPSFGPQQDWATGDSWNLRDQTYTTGDLLFSIMDIDGDGLPDRVKQGYSDSGLGSDGPDYDFRIKLNNGSGFDENATWPSNGTSLNDHIQDSDIYTHDYTYDYVDFNGDGRPDRVWQDASTAVNFRLNTGAGFGPDQSWSSSGTYLREMDRDGNTVSDYLDMNGDGRADRVTQGATTALTINFNNGNGFDASVTWESTGNFLRAVTRDEDHPSNSNGDNIRDYIDMNGDGLPDRVWQGSDSVLYIRFNTGSGFSPDTVSWTGLDSYIRNTVDSTSAPDHAMSDYMDFNGDGLVDRVVQNNSTSLTVLFNTGNGFGNSMTIGSAYNWLRQQYVWGSGYASHLTCGDYVDMNGDGILDRIWKLGNYFNQMSPISINFCQAGAPGETFLTKVISSAGGSTEYAYAPVDRAVNPDYKIKAWVLVGVTNNNGFGNSTTTTYGYTGGEYDSDERVLNGFREITVTSPTGDYIKTFYHQTGHQKGSIEKQVSYCSTGEIFSYTYNVYEDYAQRPDHYGYGISQARPLAGPNLAVEAIKLLEVRNYVVDGSTDIDAGIAPGGTAGADWFLQKKLFTYDQYGNIRETTWGDYSPGDWGYDKTTEYAEYINDLNKWLLLPKRTYKYGYSSNHAWMQASDKRYYYDECAYGQLTQGLLTKVEEYAHETKVVATDIGYDQYGNVQSIKSAGGDSFYAVHDSNFRSYIVRKTSPQVNGIQITTTTEYNGLMLPYKETDPNGAVTETGYDVFNRVKKVISPGDAGDFPLIQYEYHESDGNYGADGTPYAWEKISIREKTNQPGTLDSFIYFDGSGNTVQTKRESLDENKSPCWNTVSRWAVVEGNKKATYETIPVNTASSGYDRPDNPTGVYSRSEEYFDPSAGKVKMTTDSSGLDSRVYQKHFTETSIDKTGRVGKSEFFPRTMEGRSYSYTGTYPTQSLYSTNITKEYFNQKTIIDNDNNEIVIYRDWMGRKLETNDPDMGTWHYEYDDKGNLTKQTDANNNIITLEYDELGRMVKKVYPNALFILFNYDGLDESGNYDGQEHGACLGKLTRVIYPGNLGNESYQYDIKGRIVEMSKTIDGKTKVKKMEYDSMGRMIKETLPDNEAVTYTYHEGGELLSVIGNQTYVSEITYTPTQKINSITYGNGVATAYDYYDQNYEVDSSAGIAHSHRLKQISTNKGVLLNTTYGYDKNGNIKQKSDLEFSEFSESYSYDDLNRLTSAHAELYGDRNYVYDELNNIIVKDSRSYLYSPARPHAVINDGIYDYSYDNNGNMTHKYEATELISHITYDYENRVTGISGGALFSYDHVGNRIIKQEGNIKTIYFFNNYEEVYESGEKTDTFKYYSADSMRVAQFSTATGLVYIHTDQLGSSVRLSDTNGDLVNILAYAPYGEELEISIESIPDNLVFSTPLVDITEHYKAKNTIRTSTSIEGISDIIFEAGVSVQFSPGFKVQRGAKFRAGVNAALQLAITLGTAKPKYKFTGKELDSSGLYYFGARYYNPVLGRFISPDTILDGLNRYAYCRNNPVVISDPTGRFAWYVPLIAAIVGGIIGGINAYLNEQNVVVGVFAGMAIGAAAGASGSFVGDLIIGGLGGGLGATIIGSMVGGATAGFIGGTGFGLQTGLYQGLEGRDLWNHALTQGGIGALAGASAGILAPFGGGDWLLSTLTGAVEGAAVGGLYAALTGGNFWEGLAWGALFGGVGGFCTSENVLNLLEGNGFRTNHEIINNYLHSGQYMDAINYARRKYDFDYPVGLDLTSSAFGYTTPAGDVFIGARGVWDAESLLATIQHEGLHRKEIYNSTMNWSELLLPYNSRPHEIRAHDTEIKNAGRLHIDSSWFATTNYRYPSFSQFELFIYSLYRRY